MGLQLEQQQQQQPEPMKRKMTKMKDKFTACDQQTMTDGQQDMATSTSLEVLETDSSGAPSVLEAGSGISGMSTTWRSDTDLIRGGTPASVSGLARLFRDGVKKMAEHRGSQTPEFGSKPRVTFHDVMINTTPLEADARGESLKTEIVSKIGFATVGTSPIDFERIVSSQLPGDYREIRSCTAERNRRIVPSPMKMFEESLRESLKKPSNPQSSECELDMDRSEMFSSMDDFHREPKMYKAAANAIFQAEDRELSRYRSQNKSRETNIFLRSPSVTTQIRAAQPQIHSYTDSQSCSQTPPRNTEPYTFAPTGFGISQLVVSPHSATEYETSRPITTERTYSNTPHGATSNLGETQSHASPHSHASSPHGSRTNYGNPQARTSPCPHAHLPYGGFEHAPSGLPPHTFPSVQGSTTRIHGGTQTSSPPSQSPRRATGLRQHANAATSPRMPSTRTPSMHQR